MMQRWNAEDWKWHQYQKVGDTPKEVEFALDPQCRLKFEVRSEVAVTVVFIDHHGQRFYYNEGKVVSFDGVLENFAFFAIVPDGFWLWSSTQLQNRFLEPVDDTPAVVFAAIEGDPVKRALMDALRIKMEQWKHEGLMANDVEVAEMIEDFEYGDMDIDGEEDPFSLQSAAERNDAETLARRQAEAEAERTAEEKRLRAAEGKDESSAPPGKQSKPKAPAPKEKADSDEPAE